MRRPSFSIALAFLACLAMAPLSAAAQVSDVAPAAVDQRANLWGVVRDMDGKPVGGADVTASSPSATQTVVTSKDGRFAFHDLPVETYTVVVSVSGHKRSETDGVTVVGGKGTSLPITLIPGIQTIGGVVKSSSPTAINASAASVASLSGDTFIEQGQVSILNTLDQIPGIDAMRYQGGAPGANSNISIRGAMPYEVQVLLDGNPVNSSAAGAYGFNSTFLNSLLIAGVDAYKGPGAQPDVVANSIGGTLNFRTPAITTGLTATALVGHDSWGGGYLMFRFSDTFGKFGVLFGAAEDNTPGYMSPTDVLVGYHAVTPTPSVVPPTTVSGFATMTQNFYTKSQVAKLAYNFSPVTSLTLTDYSTQTYNDESGLGNYSPYVVAPEVCTSPTSTKCYYTAPVYSGLVGKTADVFSASGNEDEYDIEPFVTAAFRTPIGAGTFHAGAYYGAIVRTINGLADQGAVSGCINPACSENYYQAPFGEIQSDTQRGADAQYVYPFATDDTAIIGYEHNLDIATMCEGDTTSYVGIGGARYNCTPGAGLFKNIPVQTDTFSLRLDAALSSQTRFQLGNYFSSATGVAPRYDPHAGLVFNPTTTTAIRLAYGTSFVAPFAGYALPASNVYGSGTGATLITTATNDKPETSSGFDLGTDIATDVDARLSLDLYSTHIFNRFATVTSAGTGTFDGVPYFNVQQNFNQADAREEGVELSYVKAPHIGFGYSVDAELNRDYAYAQTLVPGTALAPAAIFATANGVQIPELPFSRETYALTYAFRSGLTARLAGTSYGQWNSLGQPGFTVVDSSVRVPLGKAGLAMNVGVTNLFNQGGASNVYTINNYGYSYVSVSGATVYRQWYPYQPRTGYIQLISDTGKR
jgi:outer membrane receptor protein involved in Fe transport